MQQHKTHKVPEIDEAFMTFGLNQQTCSTNWFTMKCMLKKCSHLRAKVWRQHTSYC